MGIRPKQTFLQRRHTGGQQTQEEILNHSLLEKNKSKLHRGITSHWSEWPSTKYLQTINAGEDVEERQCSCTIGGNVN